uniref:Protein S100-A13 n=2 Tax=Sus scrofa TaxID=9823 RepID=A0A8D2ACY3_PIG
IPPKGHQTERTPKKDPRPQASSRTEGSPDRGTTTQGFLRHRHFQSTPRLRHLERKGFLEVKFLPTPPLRYCPLVPCPKRHPCILFPPSFLLKLPPARQPEGATPGVRDALGCPDSAFLSFLLPACQPCEDSSSSSRVPMAAEPLTELEMAIETVVTTFFNFAGREGRKGSLSINEFKELVTQQLPHLLKDVGSLDEKMKSLDVNQDSELKFNEYWRLIGELAKEIRKEKALGIQKK